jgi:hypothetical protein
MEIGSTQMKAGDHVIFHITRRSLYVTEVESGGDKRMHEKDLYSAIETFLETQKNCLSGDVGTERSLKRGKTSLRADVFGVSNEGEKIIYLCEGKKELEHRNFGKVVGEAIELQKYADYVY